MNSFEKLREVPAQIRQWFGSEDVVDSIIEIEDKFSLDTSEPYISELLFQVEIKELPLGQLVTELERNLAVSSEIARAIYADIKEEILRPVAHELVAWGVGETELSDIAPQAALPRPVGLPTPSPTPAFPPPLRPAAVPAAPAQAPVSLYRDTFASQTAVASPRLNTLGTGDISGSVPSAPVSMRAARIDLGGVPSTKADDQFKSIFVQRETPKPQKIDYGVPPPAMPSFAPTPVSLASVPSPIPDSAPPSFTAPSLEITSVAPSPQAAAPVASGGIFDSIMQRVAPWHAAKFSGARADRSTEALQPSATVNYSDVPAAPVIPQAPQALPLGDLPTPPPPQA